MGAAESGEADAEDAALAVADPDLHLGAGVRAGEDEALPDERLVEGVGAVAPGFAGLAEEGRDAAPLTTVRSSTPSTAASATPVRERDDDRRADLLCRGRDRTLRRFSRRQRG
jgi:hypothetical protein